jgi:hypothetical protein
LTVIKIKVKIKIFLGFLFLESILTKIFNVLVLRKIFGKNLDKNTKFCSTKLF